jgi:hypothetical protein
MCISESEAKIRAFWLLGRAEVLKDAKRGSTPFVCALVVLLEAGIVAVPIVASLVDGCGVDFDDWDCEESQAEYHVSLALARGLRFLNSAHISFCVESHNLRFNLRLGPGHDVSEMFDIFWASTFSDVVTVIGNPRLQ